MSKNLYSFDDFNASSKLVRALINENEQVQAFVSSFFSEKNVLLQTDKKEFTATNRTRLVERLTAQNKNISLSDLSKKNIAKLNSQNVFTITTGHQLNMATGPLYTIYKILEVINWCEQLNGTQKEKYFVPIFWMATEDHDFEEINHINLFNSKIKWQHKSADNCVVGRISTKESHEFVNQILEKFNDEELNEQVAHFLAVYSNNNTLAHANRSLINNLFGKYGLVIIDGDDKYLKEGFVEIAKGEIEALVTHNSVKRTNDKLNSLDFHQQVFLRECNLFYIEPDGERVRIEKTTEGFLIKHQNYSATELLELLKQYPERFSPNALLRPLYQESILPNVAYVGGGGEIAYWLQLKETFSSFCLQFPLLKVRDSVLLVNSKMSEQLNEFGYSILDLKKNTDELFRDFVTKNQSIELSLAEQLNELNSIKLVVLEKALAIDKNASIFIEAEFQRMANQIEKMEKKFVAAEKKNQDKSIKQLEKLQFSIFPDGGFQERFENYLSYCHLPNFVDNIKIELKKRMTAKAAIHVVNI